MKDDSQTAEWVREPERCVSSLGFVRLVLLSAQKIRDGRPVYPSWEDAAIANDIPSGLRQ